LREINNMKILVVGSDHEAALEQYFTKYLTEDGVENKLFPAQGIFYKYYNASVVNKIVFKLGLSSIYKKINQQLFSVVESYKPDIILAFKAMEIFPATWKQLKAGGIKLINYNPDNPLLFSGAGSGNKNVTDSIPLFDLHVTYDKKIAEELSKRYQVKTACVPFGFDVSDELLHACEREQEIIKVCFLGNPDQARADFLNQLAEAGINIDVYGSNWNRFKLHENISDKGPVYGQAFWKVLRKYRLQLNFMRPHNPDSHNMRTFEVAGIGGIGLFPATTDHKAFFEDNVEIFLYNNMHECIAKAKHILSLPEHEALTVRNKVRSRCLNSHYTYKHRTLQLLSYLRELT
jgi:spore maturation protein CgeB